MSRTGDFRHDPIAASLRRAPEDWQLVRSYPSRGSAMSTARAIKTGWLEAYRPAGSFDAEVRRDADGEHVVWAQYLGDPEATALERARRIAVALEQENARLQQVVGFLLTNPLSRLSMTVYTSDIEAMAGRVTLTDDPATGKTTIGYQWRRDFLASPGGAS